MRESRNAKGSPLCRERKTAPSHVYSVPASSGTPLKVVFAKGPRDGGWASRLQGFHKDEEEDE